MTITEFLLARIAKDADQASLVLVAEVDQSRGVPEIRHRAIRERVLAECAAKRRIAELHARCDLHDRPGDECDACQRCGDGSLWPCDTLLAVAAVYADHPDFDPAWEIDPPA